MIVKISPSNSFSYEFNVVAGALDFSGFPSYVERQPYIEAFNNGDYLVIPEPVPTPVIRTINMRRLRLALLQLDLLDDIDAAIAAQPRSAQIEWEFAIEVKADHPLVVQFVAALNLDIDAIIDLAESFT